LLNDQGRNGSLGNRNVLFNGPRAGSHGADNVSPEPDRNAATEDHDFTGVTFLNAKKRLPRLRNPRQLRSRLVEESRRHCLIDSEFDFRRCRCGAWL
jgi:hypothetical protein